jgi:hypothetical protein
MKERDPKETPGIIDDLNVNLKPSEISVEGIAAKILYEWKKTDPEFSGALEILKTIQEEDPFKTGTVEDSQVNAMVITVLLLETKDRHYKSSQL